MLSVWGSTGGQQRGKLGRGPVPAWAAGCARRASLDAAEEARCACLMSLSPGQGSALPCLLRGNALATIPISGVKGHQLALLSTTGETMRHWRIPSRHALALRAASQDFYQPGTGTFLQMRPDTRGCEADCASGWLTAELAPVPIDILAPMRLKDAPHGCWRLAAQQRSREALCATSSSPSRMWQTGSRQVVGPHALAHLMKFPNRSSCAKLLTAARHTLC
jgi:hypothetical protein